MPTRRTIRAGSGVLALVGLATLTLTTVAGAEAEFVEGSGTARAQLARFAPRTGGLSYAVSTGVALASYEGTAAKAQAQTLDLGFFGLIATTVTPCGREPFLRPDQLPQPLRANSTNGPPTAERSTAGAGPAASGAEMVKAEPGAASSARSATTIVELPGAVRIDGGATSADTRLLPGAGRQAHASTSIGSVSLAGGAVELVGLHWDVTQHTGAEPVGRGAFSIDEVRVMGQRVGGLPEAPEAPGVPEASGAHPALEAARTALAALGMTLQPPAVLTAEDGTVEVSPLRLTLGGKTSLSGPAGEALASLQPARQGLAELAQGDPQNCQDPRGAAVKPITDASLLLADISLAPLTGTGGLDIELGGVRAMTEGTAYDSPFGRGTPLPAPLRPAPPAVPKRAAAPRPAPIEGQEPALPLPDRAGPRVVVSAPPPQLGAGVVPATAVFPDVELAVVAPLTERITSRCATRHPLGRPACSHGAGTVAGVGALAVALGLLGGDALLARRRPDVGDGALPNQTQTEVIA